MYDELAMDAPIKSQNTRPADRETIRIYGARTHNLKNINLEIPRNKLVVFTGRSGSGKSSLAFDTLYAEGQRQYIDSLSIFSRQFFKQLPRADVDRVEGLQPTLCLDQSHGSSNRRSTVGTITEVYDFLRILMARVGEIHCYGCNEPIRQQTPQQIRDAVLDLPERTKVMVLAPLVAGETGMHQAVFKAVRRERLVRVRVDGELHDIDRLPELASKSKHWIEAVADRIIVREGIEDRLLESIDSAVRISSQGQVICCWQQPASNPGEQGPWTEKLFSTRYSCPECDINYAEVEPRIFSFNSPFGACEECKGLGQFIQFDPDLVTARELSIDQGAIHAWRNLSGAGLRKKIELLLPILTQVGFSTTLPLQEMKAEQWDLFLNSADKKSLGLRMVLEKELATTASDNRIEELEGFQTETQCAACSGSRVSRQARAIFVAGKHVGEVVNLSIDEARKFFESLELTGDRSLIAEPIVKEIVHRLNFLQKVGVGYLTLGRSAKSLSGGEHQRVRLASSIGTGLTSVCFVLDEPSIGLHQRDNDRLIAAIRDLQIAGNSVIVVEHDEAMIRAADHVIDIGPGAGTQGGRVVSQGTAESIGKEEASVTGGYLSGRLKIESPASRRAISAERVVSIKGARGNNLQSIDVIFPLGVFCCVTGVSGSGKSTLVNHTLAPALKRQLELVSKSPEPYDSIAGLDQIDKLILVDQKPIGRSPRGCPATYTGVLGEIRKLFAATKMAKQRGYGAGRFSFNSKAGWCLECQGRGVRRMKMNFMPDIFVKCDSCQGHRFNVQTLQVRFGELSISDVLEMTIDEALKYFDGFSKIRTVLQSLVDVGLGYLLLGQSAITLSGGESQRIKLATELAKPETGNTLYILDEPTTGLHFEDIRELIGVLGRLVEKGNSLIVIEHNLDVIRCADWIIDLGPEGGSAGGTLMGAGTPEELASIKESHTGNYLAQWM